MIRALRFIAFATINGLFGTHALPQAPTKILDRRSPPATFTANPNIGPGGSSFKDSAHFRIYASDLSKADTAIQMLEGAYECFIGTMGWRSSGLSYNDPSNQGSYTKTNVYSVASLPGAAGVMHSDASTGMGWLEVQNDYLANPNVVVHEYGHVMHYHQRTWVDQGRTGAWWETLANWVADTFQTSDICASARSAHNWPAATTSSIEVQKLIGDSFQVIVDGSVDTGNYYQAWPFLTYLTNNPDNINGLGVDTLHQMMVQYSPNSNETPLHTLARVAVGTSVAQIVGKYWARMAYIDIKHPLAQKVFLNDRANINFANVDSLGNSAYRVKSARAPRYMGANITPLKTSSGASISISITSASQAYTATLAVRNTSSNTVRYVSFSNGTASTTLASGEEATFILANTPANLVLYDPFSLSTNVNTGLDYSFTMTGATPSS
ncbi:hypothetical protein GQ53DRAFT_887509 [Thozetella sp. PMI_491]|nr:hypothetical protein GQ53DRAFT_887509 [Thozetella sp. PMI_491]